MGKVNNYRSEIKNIEYLNNIKTIIDQVKDDENINTDLTMQEGFDKTNIKILNINKENKSFMKNKKDTEDASSKEKQVSDLHQHIKNIINNLSIEQYEALISQGIDIDNCSIESLALTLKKVSEVEEAIELARSIKTLSANSVLYLVKNELKPTIEDLYKSQYINENKQEIEETKDDTELEDLEENIKELLLNNQMEIDDYNISSAKWCIKNKIPITKDNLQYKKDLENIQLHLNDQEIVKKINKTIEDGTEAKKTLVIDNSKGYKEELDETKFRRQLEERRLKLTFESAKLLTDKGMELDLKPLKQLIDSLKAKEELYSKMLIEEGQDYDVFSQTIGKMEEMKKMPVSLLSFTMKNRDFETINSLIDQGNKLIYKLDLAKESYELMQTKPNKEYGDSITKAFNNIGNILEGLDIEDNQTNQRAARILGYNNMEISHENIDEIKVYDMQVNNLIKNLTPRVTMYLINHKINPLEINIANLNKMVNNIKEEVDKDDEEKYSEFLWKLDKENGITREDRKAYVGIYRLLYQIEKSDGLPIASLVKADKDLTLKNLLEANKTLKTHIDKTINDDFGFLENLEYEGETIREQINTFYLNNILENISPKKLHSIKEELAQEFKEILNISLESFNEMLDRQVDNNEVIHSEGFEKIKNILKNSGENISFLRDYKLAVTPNNLELASFIIKGKDVLYKGLQKLYKKRPSQKPISKINNLADKVNDETKLVEEINEVFNEVDRDLKEIILEEGQSVDDVARIIEMKRLNKFTNILANKRYYQIPINKEDEIWNINLTIINDKDKEASTSISFLSESIGRVSIWFKVADNNFSGNILCSMPKGLDYLKNLSKDFEQVVKDNNVNYKDISYALADIGKISYIYSEKGNKDNISTNTLFNIAKDFIKVLDKAN